MVGHVFKQYSKVKEFFKLKLIREMDVSGKKQWYDDALT